MAQHFLLSREAKTLSLAAVFRMSDAEAEARFRAMRWAETNGEPVCPECGCIGAYEFRRPNGALRFECKACKKGFTRDLGVSCKCAFVLAHKLREAMAEEMRGRKIGGEDKVCEIDGGFFGGYVKPANRKRNALTAVCEKTNPASAAASSSFVSAAVIQYPAFSTPKARRFLGSKHASRKKRPFTLTTPKHGTNCTPAMK